MISLINLAVLFVAKVADNALSTTKTILVQRSRWILAGIAVIISDFIYFWITKRVVSANNEIAMLVVAVAGGVGCSLACFINEKMSKDRTYVNVIMSDDLEEMKRLRDFLALHHITNVASDSYTLAVMVGTGLRVGELTGLRWCDIDLEEGIIDVNHTLVYYDHRTEGSKKGCYFNVNTTKTPAGMRQVPMLEFVKEAFLMEKERQELLGLHCEAAVDGYTDFVFVNRFGQPQHQATLNKAIRRIIRNCNDKQFLESENPEVLLPHFSCHSLRHTFTTRMCEAGVNVKVIQDALGHKDVSTTLNIYTDVTKELRKSEFEGLELQFNQ